VIGASVLSHKTSFILYDLNNAAFRTRDLFPLVVSEDIKIQYV